MSERWLEELVESFWKTAGAGYAKIFPRRMEEAVLWALPLAIFKLPRLSIGDTLKWLARYRLAAVLPEDGGKEFHAFLIAYRGRGCVLLNGADSEAEQRFSLAHEVAHFLVDYLEPRRRVQQKLGEGALEVLDGLRPPTIVERIGAILANAPLGVYTSYLPRGRHQHHAVASFLFAEDRADRLALELLAPAATVWQKLCEKRALATATFRERVGETARLLIDFFGLPEGVAGNYAQWLCRQWFGGPELKEWLGL